MSEKPPLETGLIDVTITKSADNTESQRAIWSGTLGTVGDFMVNFRSPNDSVLQMPVNGVIRLKHTLRRSRQFPWAAVCSTNGWEYHLSTFPALHPGRAFDTP